VFVLSMLALFALVIALLTTGMWLLVSSLTRASA